MLSNVSAGVLSILLVFFLVFLGWSLCQPRNLLHALYRGMLIAYCLWLLLLLGIWGAKPWEELSPFALDVVARPPGFTSVFFLLIALTFARSYEKLPRLWPGLFLVPGLVTAIALAVTWRRLVFRSVPLPGEDAAMVVLDRLAAGYGCICCLCGAWLLLDMGRRGREGVPRKKCLLLGLCGAVPPCAVILAAWGDWNLPAAAMPIVFLPLVAAVGVVVHRLRLQDLKPAATQHVLDKIADCYIILGGTGLVVSFNCPFETQFAAEVGIRENAYLRECLKGDTPKTQAMRTLLRATEQCLGSGHTVSYEQAVPAAPGNGQKTCYYIVEVTPLSAERGAGGCIGMFKDVTKLRRSMQQLQESQTRMMMQERFAFLGQMMGGLAHNLKTPIMSIAGCVSAAEDLVTECEISLDDAVVTREDYAEIYAELRMWMEKTLDACGYMSDIITAVKGQANSVGGTETGAFSLEELCKRASLLIRHELQSGNCNLEIVRTIEEDVQLHGDINNLIQVLVNLLSNAIDAQLQVGGGVITMEIDRDESHLRISVRDRGAGIAPEIKSRLFREMTTSKGINGSGLGLYISNAVVQINFGGYMWADNCPEGGAVLGVAIPLEYTDLKPTEPGTAVKSDAADGIPQGE